MWNQNGPAPPGEFANFFPGQKYVDVVSHDNYRDLNDRYYYEIMALADGKVVALGELGTVPSPEILKAQPKWAWFMLWSGRFAERAKTGYDNHYILTRGDPIPGQ